MSESFVALAKPLKAALYDIADISTQTLSPINHSELPSGPFFKAHKNTFLLILISVLRVSVSCIPTVQDWLRNCHSCKVT